MYEHIWKFIITEHGKKMLVQYLRVFFVTPIVLKLFLYYNIMFSSDARVVPKFKN